MSSVITTQGVQQSQQQLRAVAERANDQTDTMDAEARAMQRRIKGVPEDTGRLARSVAGGADTLRRVWKDGYLIGSLVEYAPFVFGGTRYMAARPPRVPDDAGERAAAAIARDLERA